MHDPEDHGAEGPHTHRVRWIAARRRPAHEFDGEQYKAASRHQKEWGRKLIESLGLAGDERVLDLGCGDGILTAAIAGLLPHGSALGIDASEGMISSAQTLEAGNLSFRRLRIEAMDFTGEFDVIFSNATLHWVKDHEKLLRDCGRALRPGGSLHFNFAGELNCSNFNTVVKNLMDDAHFRLRFGGFEWPWYMPGVEEYRRLAVQCQFLEDVRVSGESADRAMTRDELVRWIDQPSLVPFLAALKGPDKRAFRDAVVDAMLDVTRRDDDEYFETFRRINVFARKRK